MQHLLGTAVSCPNQSNTQNENSFADFLVPYAGVNDPNNQGSGSEG